ncbi:MAG: cation:proton antiporter regulatory subunit, partial [Chitinophagaceae bacterium]
VIIIGIILITTNYLKPFLQEWFNNPFHGTFISTIITLLLIAPFLWALTIRRIERLSFTRLWLNTVYNRGPLVLMELLRLVLCVLIIGFLLNSFFSVKIALLGASLVIIIIILIFSKRLQSFYGKIEKRFLGNLRGNKTDVSGNPELNLVPWDGHLSYFDVPAESSSVGKTLTELAWREKFGINVALIERGQRVIRAPGRDERIYPADRLAVIGTDEQLENFSRHIQITDMEDIKDDNQKMGLVQIIIDNHSSLMGKSIRNSGIRNNVRGLVVGIERNGTRELNPDSSFTFENGDVVWIAGNKDLIKKLR